MDDISVEEKIIRATIDCIEEFGIVGATTRRIAKSAEVNIAAINYYFRSKDRLIEIGLHQTMENSFGDWQRDITDRERDLDARLRKALVELFRFVID